MSQLKLECISISTNWAKLQGQPELNFKSMPSKINLKKKINIHLVPNQNYKMMARETKLLR